MAYLLARATDTVADSSNFPVDERIAVLEDMRALINSPSGPELENLSLKLKRVCKDGVGHEGEQVLLSKFNQCIILFNQLPEKQKKLIRKVLNTIIDGQVWDLDYFSGHTHVTSVEDLDLYTYRVAGCVGEFWTEIGFLCYGERFSTHPLPEMLRMGRLYGEGLQLVNIIRDQKEDAENGRFYLPLDDEKNRIDSSYWMEKAREKLQQGILYSQFLHGFKVRFSSVLPAWLGIDTLDLIAENPYSEKKIKISRKTVKKRVWKALFFSARIGFKCVNFF